MAGILHRLAPVMPRLFPGFLLLAVCLLGSGCSYLYSPPVNSEPYRAPGAVGPRQGELRGGVAYSPTLWTRVAGSLSGAVPLGHHWHVEFGGGVGQEWVMGHGGMRKTWVGELDEKRAQPVGDLAFRGGLGVGGGYSSGAYFYGDERVAGDLPWDTTVASWKQRRAAGGAVEAGLGARVDDVVTPFLRIRLQFSVTEDLPVTYWGDVGGGVSFYPGRGPFGIDLSAAFAVYSNSEDQEGFLVIALGLSLALGPP